MFKILALDGGGIRSIFQARLIERIEIALGQPLKADLYAGTSGGAILACGLQRLKPRELITFFQTYGPRIFQKEKLWKEIDDAWNLLAAKYPTAPLQASLASVFGSTTMAQLPSHTLITAFNLRAESRFWEPVVFHNFPGMKASPDLDVVDALLRSTAAPTYFPVYQNHCDGGVWGNNPSMAALAASLDAYVGHQSIDEIVLISIGNGRRPTELHGAKRDLGALDWYKNRIFELMMDGNTEASHYYSRSVLNARYLRIQFDLDSDIRLDEAARMDELLRYADRIDIAPIQAWLKGFWI